jgi:hypothetical protein
MQPKLDICGSEIICGNRGVMFANIGPNFLSRLCTVIGILETFSLEMTAWWLLLTLSRHGLSQESQIWPTDFCSSRSAAAQVHQLTNGRSNAI